VGAPLVAAALALTLGACGDGGPGQCPAGQTGTPPNCMVVCPAGTIPPDCRVDCTQTSVYQDSGGIPGETILYDDFSVPDSGRLDVTLDWTNASSPMGFYLVPANTCTLDEFNARSCNFLIRSEPSTTKPRKISTPNFNAGNYRWMIANYSSEQESVSFLVVLSKGSGCPALAGGSPSASAREDATLPPIARTERR
jgi:hypothetical protein